MMYCANKVLDVFAYLQCLNLGFVIVTIMPRMTWTYIFHMAAENTSVFLEIRKAS